MLNINTKNLLNEINLANNYYSHHETRNDTNNKKSSILAFAYEKARNAVEYKDEHLIRQAAIERIIKRRIFLNQSSEKIANLLIKELTWARYINTEKASEINIEKFKKIIEKYRDFEQLVGLCACEIDELLNFNPLDQIIINYVSQTLLTLVEIKELDEKNKQIQIYIATERCFAKSNEVLIKYKLLKVLLPNWNNKLKLHETLSIIDEYLNYKGKDRLRRSVSKLIPPFNLIKDLLIREQFNLSNIFENKDLLKDKLKDILEEKYVETKNKLIRATKRSIIYIFLTKVLLALVIEIPFDVIFGNVNYTALLINILFPPSLMFLFNSRIKLPDSNNTFLMTNKALDYFFNSQNNYQKVILDVYETKSNSSKVFDSIFIFTSIFELFSIIYVLNLISFNFINQLIFLFFLSVVSFFSFRVKEVSDDYILPDSKTESILESLLDYLFLPIIKTGQWLSNQISKVNILSFIFDFIIEAPLKSFIEILEQWLHFVRVKKEEFLG